MLQQHEGWLSAAGAAPSNTWRQSTCGCSRKRRTRSSGSRRSVALSNPDLMIKVNIRHISGRPSSAPKLTMDTESTFFMCVTSHGSVMTLVRQAAANEVAVPSRAEYETWIDEYRINFWGDGWMDIRSHHYLLLLDGPGTALVEIVKSC